MGKIVAPVEKKSMSLVKYEPYGVVGCIIPWNYPLSYGVKLPCFSCWQHNYYETKEITSLSILRWVEAVSEIMPPGVMNVITGYGSKLVKQS